MLTMLLASNHCLLMQDRLLSSCSNCKNTNFILYHQIYINIFEMETKLIVSIKNLNLRIMPRRVVMTL